jgi:hypothetical protein
MADRKKDKWLKVFCPEDACLREEERIVLPASEETEEHSVWLEVFCPEDSCEITSPTQLPEPSTAIDDGAVSAPPPLISYNALIS